MWNIWSHDRPGSYTGELFNMMFILKWMKMHFLFTINNICVVLRHHQSISCICRNYFYTTLCLVFNNAKMLCSTTYITFSNFVLSYNSFDILLCFTFLNIAFIFMKCLAKWICKLCILFFLFNVNSSVHYRIFNPLHRNKMAILCYHSEVVHVTL